MIFNKRNLLCLLVGGFASASMAQMPLESNAETALKYAQEVTKADMVKHLSILASDEYEGRETGTEGQRKAAAYLVKQITSFGLEPLPGQTSLEQEIAFTKERWTTVASSTSAKTFKHLWDFCAFPATNTDWDTSFDEVVFLGYGIQDDAYNDYAGANVSGKLIMVYDGEPTNAAGVSYITGTVEPSDWSSDFRKKFKAAKANGAAGILIIDKDIKNRISTNRNRMLNGRMRIGKGENPGTNYAPNMFISSTMAQDILGKKGKKVIKARKGIEKSGKPKSVSVKTNISFDFEKETRTLIGSNVSGMITGSDPVLKEEYVFVTAHYDHLGKRGESIYNGADDNGSGTTTILEVAESMAKAKREGNGPKRSVVFIWVSGEEKGLLGSAYYVNDPIIPFDQTIVDINVDMVGRVDKKYTENPNYIYVIGADKLSQDLHDINESVNQGYHNLALDYTYNDENDPNRYYYRSDHYNFARNNIPVVFFFNGTHDDYHMVTDTVEKINFDKMEKIGQHVFYLTWEIANRAQRPQLNR
jgi:hypothetical protein